MPQPPVIFLAFANDREDETQYLRNLPKEQKLIREALAPAQKAGLCEVVERSNVSLAELLDVLQSEEYRDRIAIFHYGGHATSYQLLLETLEGKVATAHSQGLNGLLGRRNSLKLVFLNGCCTELQSKALNEAGVPLVIGTQKVIRDDIATKLATRFYRGLGRGLNIEQAWRDAEDELKTEADQEDGYRGFLWPESNYEEWPWDLHKRGGTEQILSWNLPEAAGDPLFGLPPLPADISFPQPPYLYLQRYERAYAKLFAGRAAYIRQLYNLVTDQNGPFLIHLYGASGVGKSSLLDAGLLPRLEHQTQVVYLRRDGKLSANQLILDTLTHLSTQTSSEEQYTPINLSDIQETLSQLKQTQLSENDKNIDHIREYLAQLSHMVETYQRQSKPTHKQINDKADVLQKWHQIEHTTRKPLVIILDQLESIFLLDNHKQQEQEWEGLFDILKTLHHSSQSLRGKLLFSYRKEYYPEIEGMLKQAQLPFQTLFLDKLKEDSVIEIVHHLERPTFESVYHLAVEEGLGQLISNEVLRHEAQSVAPILQILLTKMWEEAETSNHDKRVFSEDLYRSLSRKGLLLQNFFEEQMHILEKQDAAKVKSGLALDLLHAHTNLLGTAVSREQEDLARQYEHIPQIAAFIADCVNHTFLLRQSGNRLYLIHDTLAPIVRQAYHQSDAAGQKAVRILESRVRNHEDISRSTLGEADLKQVMEGKEGMRKWTEEEQQLVLASQEALQKQKRRQKQIRYALTSLLILFLAASTLGTIAYFNYRLTYGNLQRIEGQLDTVSVDLAQKKDSIEQINNSLIEREAEIQNLEQLGKSLELSNQAFQAQSTVNRKKFRSNQLAAQSTRTQDGYQAFQLAIEAYEQFSENPLALGAMIAAYQKQPFSQSGINGQDLELSELCDVVLKDGKLLAMNASGQTTFTMPYSEDSFDTSGDGVAVSPDGKYMAALFGLTEILVWNREGVVDTLPTSGEFITQSPQFLKQNPHLLLVSDSTLWNIHEGLFQPLIYRGKTQKIAQFPKSNKWLIAQDKSLKIWDATYQKSLLTWNLDKPLKDLAVNPNGTNIATASGTQLQLWNLQGQLLGTFDNNQRDVYQLSFSPDGKYLLSAESENQAVVWETHRQRPIAVLQTGSKNWRIPSANFSSNERWVATASTDAYIRIWDWQSASPRLLEQQQLDHAAQHIAFDPSSRYIICVDIHSNLYIWHWQGGRLKRRSKSPFPVPIQKLKIRPSNRHFDIWVQGKEQSRLLRFSPDDNYFYELFIADKDVIDASFSTDGKWLWLATEEGIQEPLLLEPNQMIDNIGF